MLTFRLKLFKIVCYITMKLYVDDTRKTPNVKREVLVYSQEKDNSKMVHRLGHAIPLIGGPLCLNLGHMMMYQYGVGWKFTGI